MSVLSWQQICAAPTRPPIEHFGAWRYDASTFTLVMAENRRDERIVDLDRLTTPAMVLDTIAQIAGKTGVTEDDLGHLVRALDAILGLQTHYCSFGRRKTADPRKVAAERGYDVPQTRSR